MSVHKHQIIKTTGLVIGLILFASLLVSSSCKRTQTLIVETEPKGANVYIDNRLVGQTPTQVNISANQRLRLDFKQGDITTVPPAKEISKTLTTAYIPLTAYLPLFVALDRGYFEHFGIKVNATDATSPNDIITGIAAEQVDFAAALAYPILLPAANQFPGKFRFFSSSAETSKRFTSSIIVKKDSPINSYNDLRGKKIGVYTGLVQVNFLKAMLVGMGIDPKEVQIIEISPRLQIQGLVSGQYDALSSTEPTTNIARLQGIAKVVIENPRVKYIMCPFPSTAAAVSTKLLKEDPETAQGVIKALNMAIDFINSYPEEAKKVLPKYTPIPKDIETAVLADLKLFQFSKLGEENRLNVQKFADYLFENGLLSQRNPDVNKLFGDFEESCPE
jgi:NitT/TauT family transport system substrate-binding protein